MDPNSSSLNNSSNNITGGGVKKIQDMKLIIEILVNDQCSISFDELRKHYLVKLYAQFELNRSQLIKQIKRHGYLSIGSADDHMAIDRVSVYCNRSIQMLELLSEQEISAYVQFERSSVFFYKQYKEGASNEELFEDVGSGEQTVSPYQQWVLPNIEFATLWDNLIYDDSVKERLLSYASTILLFSSAKVDSNIVSNNKIVLLTGPPGSGKTSLAKALSQKLAIRHSDRYAYPQLIEINSHSLFSKWFSESGKLVMKVFEKIREILDDPSCFVTLLIDEVESLAAARTAALSGSEPTDSIRVVNAFLTQLDQIKSYPNLLIVATSNLTTAIDLAFIDRADLKLFIGPPSLSARKRILKSIDKELMDKGILYANQPIDKKQQKALRSSIYTSTNGFSGRSLRKLPFLSVANYQTKSLEFPIPLAEYQIELNELIQREKEFNKVIV
ncbi:hypothetical protein CYY_002575 [Polysphondylium violaceum]|uniref:AAA+ ATPase domain-containing protein n=1 Tax=Polysphondylium violaceum TaxID=133409 RepID=A0A8J4PW27_9MYCE|nr:hypothetical protein CYY_002575 [Polysphondylium violaceum]